MSHTAGSQLINIREFYPEEGSHFGHLDSDIADLSEPDFAQRTEADTQLLEFHDRLVWDSLNWTRDRHEKIGASDENPISGEALLQKRAKVLVYFDENDILDRLYDYIPEDELDNIIEEIEATKEAIGKTALKLVSVS